MRFYYRFEFDRQIFFRNQVSVEKEPKKQRPLSTPISSAGVLLRAQYDNISALQLLLFELYSLDLSFSALRVNTLRVGEYS